MKKILLATLTLCAFLPIRAQRVLTLDNCRELALRNNKQLNVSRLNKDVATNTRKAIHTKYLPKVDAAGAYQYTSKEVSILDKDQKNALSNFGSNVGSQVTSDMTPVITDLAQKGIITPAQAQTLAGILQQTGTSMSSALNQAGQKVRDAFRTDTRNIFVADILVRQPIYMGGAITAANKIAQITEEMADNNISTKTQATLYNIDQAYWLVVSLRQKQILAQSYLDVVKKLDSDVQKMIKQGIATKAEGLKVSVKVNEAEMSKTQVDDGLVLSKMYLCQLCGISMDEDVKLADEDRKDLDTPDGQYDVNRQVAIDNRPELRVLQNTIDISKQNTKLARAAFLPQIAAIGGYMISNPNVFNGFERKFSGYFHIGVAVRVPIWNWFEGRYTVRANHVATQIAQMEFDDVKEKIDLQVSQSSFKVKEANKNLALATKNVQSAEENLRCANLGFHEGVMQTTEVMEAQTAWLQAHSQKIDAEIDVKLSEVNLEKALGTLHE